MKKHLCLVAMGLMVSACTTLPPLTADEMKPEKAAFQFIEAKSRLHRNVSVGTVTIQPTAGGGKKDAFIQPEAYKAVLTHTMLEAGWLNYSDKSRYVLNADLQRFETPFKPFYLTYKAVARYELYDTKAQQTVYSEQLTLPCSTSNFVYSNAVDVQIRDTIKCAFKENLTHLVRVLGQKF